MSHSTGIRLTVVLVAACAALGASCSPRGAECPASSTSASPPSSAAPAPSCAPIHTNAASETAVLAAATERTYRPGLCHPLAAGDGLGIATVLYEGRLLRD